MADEHVMVSEAKGTVQSVMYLCEKKEKTSTTPSKHLFVPTQPSTLSFLRLLCIWQRDARILVVSQGEIEVLNMFKCAIPSMLVNGLRTWRHCVAAPFRRLSKPP